MRQTVLLDAHDTKHRLIQNAVPLFGTALLLAGIAVIIGRQAAIQGSLAMVVGAALMLLAPRFLVAWVVPYKGHTIRFENNVVFGERLYIDGTRITSGVLGYRKTLQGVIRAGDGKGDRITAESEAGLTIFRVTITAESSDVGSDPGLTPV